MKRFWKIFLFCFACISFIGCDRITKDIAKQNLIDKPVLSYFHDVLRLEYTENTGAAFGFGDSLNPAISFWLLGFLPLVFLLTFFVYSIIQSKKLSALKLFSFALIIAGGLGNIIDRIIFHRHVTDFLNVGLFNMRTEVFNVADMCVTAGAVMLIFIYWKKEKKTLPE